MKLLKGDTVKIVAGKDKGKVGKILRAYSKEGKVLVENVNQFKRHLKKKTEGESSQIVTIIKPLPLGNVALICPKCSKVTRIGFKTEKGKKMRICKKCGKAV